MLVLAMVGSIQGWAGHPDCCQMRKSTQPGCDQQEVWQAFRNCLRTVSLLLDKVLQIGCQGALQTQHPRSAALQDLCQHSWYQRPRRALPQVSFCLALRIFRSGCWSVEISMCTMCNLMWQGIQPEDSVHMQLQLFWCCLLPCVPSNAVLFSPCLFPLP